MHLGDQYHAAGNIGFGEDADNIRVDAKTNRIFVSYGNGGFAIIDALAHRKLGEIALQAHPQGFQLDEQSNRIYANLPKEQDIAVLDYTAAPLFRSCRSETQVTFLWRSTHPRITCLSYFVILRHWPPSRQTASSLQKRKPAAMRTTCFSITSAIASM